MPPTVMNSLFRKRRLRLGQCMGFFAVVFSLAGGTSCHEKKALPTPPLDAAFIRLSPTEAASLPLAVRFEMPIGGEQGALVYNAQPFRTTRHLGDDWNGIGGWNSDLGDPIYASGTGKVVFAGVPSAGWGNMVILAHRVTDLQNPIGWEIYQTLYAHMDTIAVQSGDIVARGQRIGTVGTASGRYLAHLHFEVRKSWSVNPGVGYADAPLDRVPPDAFIRAHGGLAEQIPPPAPLLVGEQ